MEELKKDMMIAQLLVKCDKVNELIERHTRAHTDKTLEPIEPQVVDLLRFIDGKAFQDCFDNVDNILTKTANILNLVKA